MKKLSRKEMVDALIEQDIDDIRQGIYHDDFEYLIRILTGEGFVPYNNMDSREIRQEYISRIVG